MQDAYCRDNKCWISSFNISKEGNTSRWCNFNYASDRCSNLRLYWVYSPRWPCACLHRQHRNGCRYWTKGSNLHSWHIATVWDPRKRLSLVVSPIWRYAADHPESFNVRIIAEIPIPGSRCDWRPTLLGQWAVSRKKSEQWRVKSEQKKQNKMRGAVSVEQWAWSSEQKTQKKIIPFGYIASRGTVNRESNRGLCTPAASGFLRLATHSNFRWAWGIALLEANSTQIGNTDFRAMWACEFCRVCLFCPLLLLSIIFAEPHQTRWSVKTISQSTEWGVYWNCATLLTGILFLRVLTSIL